MAIITFWNNKSGHIGQSFSTITTALNMAIEHNYKILVISTKMDDTVIERAFGVSESIAAKVLGIKESKMDSGIQGLKKLAYSNKLTPEIIKNYTKIIFKNRLEVIGGDRIEIESEFAQYPVIIKNANKAYDMVFVDLTNGFDKQYQKDIIEASDVLVWNLEQQYDEINKIIKFKEKNHIIDENKIIYLFNKYEKNSKYNIKNIVRNSKIKKYLYAIPYDYMLSDVIQDGKLANWILTPQIRNSKPLDAHGELIDETKKLCEGIIVKLKEQHIMK